jgi:hypothetical protein
VSKLSYSGRPARRGPAPVCSLFLLIVFSLFQSPVQSPAPTRPPAATPTEAPSGPPQESPVVPPAETPVVPPAETPMVPPGETPVLPPSGEVTPPTGPEATPSEEASPGVPTPTEAPEEEGSSVLDRISPAVLIDACVVGLSSVWLCCGGFALVLFVLLIAASFILRVS